MENTTIHCLDVLFAARQPIRSLPPFHGARWSAWMRHACRRADLAMENLVHALQPLRNGTSPVMPGECLPLRLLVPPQALPLLPGLVRAMQDMPAKGEFCGRTLALAGFRDGLDGTPLRAEDLSAQTVPPLTDSRLAERIAAVQQCERWSLFLSAPLRLTLPAGEKKGAAGVGRFCDARFFLQPEALAHLLQHVRLLPPMACGAGIRLQDVRLHWEDMRYSRERGVALGGVVGELRALGRPDGETARRLVLGEYLGAGKNARFGLGFWRLDWPGSQALPSGPSGSTATRGAGHGA